MFELVFNPDETDPTVVPLSSGGVRVGRDEENDLILHELSVSAFHAELVCLEDGGLGVIDLGSSNGTFVNGDRINRAVLKQGDRLMFSCVHAVVTVKEQAAGELWKPRLESLAQAVRTISVRP
jgi:pSer/pThr/pTyr-binding forkhead associated (FHA) protein